MYYNFLLLHSAKKKNSKKKKPLQSAATDCFCVSLTLAFCYDF